MSGQEKEQLPTVAQITSNKLGLGYHSFELSYLAEIGVPYNDGEGNYKGRLLEVIDGIGTVINKGHVMSVLKDTKEKTTSATIDVFWAK